MNTESHRASKTARRRVTPGAREEFRNTLVEIARRIFVNEGYSAVSIRRITSEAGVTSMTFYWYFDSKEALLTVIWDDLFNEVTQRCLASIKALRTPRKRLLGYLEAFIDYWLDHPDRYRFVFVNEANGVDFAGLRSNLVSQPGAHRHVSSLDRLAASCWDEHPLRAAQVEQLRQLAMYKALGFLHCAICVYNYSRADAEAFKQLVMRDMNASIDLLDPADQADSTTA